jgi:hypothetical protein
LKFKISRFLGYATVCKQFVNKVHQFWVRVRACISLLTKCIRLLQRTPSGRLPGNQKCVVEHKGLGCAAARFGWFPLAALALLAGCISEKCIPVGMRSRFLDFRSRKVPPPSLTIWGTSQATASHSILRDGQKRLGEPVEKNGLSTQPSLNDRLQAPSISFNSRSRTLHGSAKCCLLPKHGPLDWFTFNSPQLVAHRTSGPSRSLHTPIVVTSSSRIMRAPARYSTSDATDNFTG